MAAKAKIQTTLIADRVTKGAVRFVEEGTAEWPLNIYLRHAQAEQIGVPLAVGSRITVTIEGRK